MAFFYPNKEREEMLPQLYQEICDLFREVVLLNRQGV